jgi:hypothetical protein
MSTKKNIEQMKAKVEQAKKRNIQKLGASIGLQQQPEPKINLDSISNISSINTKQEPKKTIKTYHLKKETLIMIDSIKSIIFINTDKTKTYSEIIEDAVELLFNKVEKESNK